MAQTNKTNRILCPAVVTPAMSPFLLQLIQTLVKQTFAEADEKRVQVAESHDSVLILRDTTINTSRLSALCQGHLQRHDFISGKGGGAVFLLHGNPGTGKTLTAESLAEHLKRPLYTVSVGELGITPQQLEQSLNRILELASIWKAIILLDEADVFLEKRTINDINRCALVGIFLRMLEYHDGIIFLTTNRVKCFDPAFKSRISMSLHYEDLNGDARSKIWQHFAEKDDVTYSLRRRLLVSLSYLLLIRSRYPVLFR